MEIKTKVIGLQKTIAAFGHKVREISGKDQYIVVGFPDASVRNAKGTSIAEYAYYNEMGMGMEARPFLRPSMHLSKKIIKNLAEQGMKDNVNDKKTMRQVLEKMGEASVGIVQQYIIDLNHPPNKASTIKRKGEGKSPLIDTSAMLHAVSYQITSHKPTEDPSYGN